MRGNPYTVLSNLMQAKFFVSFLKYSVVSSSFKNKEAHVVI